jgi:hypothetical protein
MARRGTTRWALVRVVCAGIALAAAASPYGQRVASAGGISEVPWVGAPGELQWRWSTSFARPAHLGLLRARFGSSSIAGVPTEFHWEVRPPRGGACEAGDDERWETLDATAQDGTLDWPDRAQPTRRSWFVDADACALRLVVDRTNAGPPAVRDVRVVESARDVLLGQEARDDGASPGCGGCGASGAVDGTYAGRWAGAPGTGRWTLRVDLTEAVAIDRVRLVLGFDATGVPRGSAGRNYAIAWGPVRYSLEVSEDGTRFEAIAHEPTRSDGTVLPLRRRMVRTAPRRVKALRLVMVGATGADGVPDAAAEPVVREIAAYGADDPRPVIAPPWVLSVNANPSGQSHREIGGEALNDAFHAKFLQRAFAPLLAGMRRDDRFTRMVGPFGEPHAAPPTDFSGESIEAVEADDPQLDARLLAESSPPPITVLSGSNDWDYAPFTRLDPARPTRWYWDPLRDAKGGGMGQLALAVTGRVAPLLGFCGGAQLLALLEARGRSTPSSEDDQDLIDRVLKRTSGHAIRGFATVKDIEWAWPADPHPRRARVSFEAHDPLFVDLAGPLLLRDTTQALPEAHADAVRADAFSATGPLSRFELLATSRFCASHVVAAGPGDGVVPAPNGSGWCDTVPEAFRSRDAGWPVIGTQFHAEQREFGASAPGDPPESVEDPRLFIAAAFEQIVDAYERLDR